MTHITYMMTSVEQPAGLDLRPISHDFGGTSVVGTVRESLPSGLEQLNVCGGGGVGFSQCRGAERSKPNQCRPPPPLPAQPHRGGGGAHPLGGGSVSGPIGVGGEGDPLKP